MPHFIAVRQQDDRPPSSNPPDVAHDDRRRADTAVARSGRHPDEGVGMSHATNKERKREMIDCWIVRKGEDPRNIAPPQEADAIAKHPECNTKCAFCGEDREVAAVMAFRPEPYVIQTMGICAQCAVPGDEPRKFSGWAACFPPKPVLVWTKKEEGSTDAAPAT
jgi:hypothetical protein